MGSLWHLLRWRLPDLDPKKSSPSRFVVGIDLGTTNTALAFADTEGNESPGVEDLKIPQLLQPCQVEALSVLPSFLYLPSDGEFPRGSLDLLWAPNRQMILGDLARQQGFKVPGRQVVSAKSWLSHHLVDPRAPILPWKAPAGSRMISPLEACTHYLGELVHAWNNVHPDEPLGSQEIVLTVPASFDPAARELTLEAAHKAGLEKAQLFEEPQSAFYSWIQSRGDSWRKETEVGEVVLVCDIGGGTTDFSLILVGQSEGNLDLQRLAVGDHILLGGDNMDWALTHLAAKDLDVLGNKLDYAQTLMLLAGCRQAKEALLGEVPPESIEVRVLGRGSRLMAGTLKVGLEREHVSQTILEGFFPIIPLETPLQRAKSFGLVEMGLPYAHDPAITRHLAQFLRRNASLIAEKLLELGKTGTLPTAILFNGGMLKANAVRQRLVDQMNVWRQAQSLNPVKILIQDDLDLAVARGAVVQGLAKRGKGVRIRGGSARSYYLGVEIPAPAVPGAPPPIKALCVVPFGMEEGTSVEIPGVELGLLVGERADFRFFGSNRRRADDIGVWLDPLPEDLEELPPLETTLTGSTGEVIPVRLKSVLTELGTLELWCQSTDVAKNWRLEFRTREGA